MTNWMNTPISSQQGQILNKKYWLANKAGHVGNKLFSIVEQYDEFIKGKQKNIAKNSFLKNTWGRVLGFSNWACKQVFDYDFTRFIPLGKNRTNHLLSPSAGFFFLTILPLTIGTRFVQALKRGHGMKDNKEVGDILWRDLTAIIAILYLMDPLKSQLVGVTQTLKGVRLKDENGILSADAVNKHYGIHTKNHLLALSKMKENKTHAIKKAFDEYVTIWEAHTKMTHHFQPERMSGIEERLHPVKQAMKEFLEKDADESQLKKASKDFYNAIKELDGYVNENMLKNFSEQGKNYIKKRFPEMKYFFAKYANNKRLPISVGSFLFTAGVIGAIPVMYNKYRADQALTKLREKEAELNEAIKKAKQQGTLPAVKNTIKVKPTAQPKQSNAVQKVNNTSAVNTTAPTQQQLQTPVITTATQTLPVNPFISIQQPVTYFLNKHPQQPQQVYFTPSQNAWLS